MDVVEGRRVELHDAVPSGLLVDATGTIVATASAPLQLSTPRPGWAEQSSEDWWKATISEN
jgi:sugar (pentulose or hexulose) kinase